MIGSICARDKRTSSVVLTAVRGELRQIVDVVSFGTRKICAAGHEATTVITIVMLHRRVIALNGSGFVILICGLCGQCASQSYVSLIKRFLTDKSDNAATRISRARVVSRPRTSQYRSRIGLVFENILWKRTGGAIRQRDLLVRDTCALAISRRIVGIRLRDARI